MEPDGREGESFYILDSGKKCGNVGEEEKKN